MQKRQGSGARKYFDDAQRNSLLLTSVTGSISITNVLDYLLIKISVCKIL